MVQMGVRTASLSSRSGGGDRDARHWYFNQGNPFVRFFQDASSSFPRTWDRMWLVLEYLQTSSRLCRPPSARRNLLRKCKNTRPSWSLLLLSEEAESKETVSRPLEVWDGDKETVKDCSRRPSLYYMWCGRECWRPGAQPTMTLLFLDLEDRS